MSGRYILDADKQAVPCDDLEKWAKAFESDSRRVARTTVGPYDVSTVFLGIDHAFGGGPPMLFETMVFGPSGSEEDMDRCPTWAEAEAMHAAFVARYQEKLS